jgi:hypothetical protein
MADHSTGIQAREMPRTAPRLVVAVAVVIVAVMPEGCSLVRERICSRGEHVVRSIEAPRTGRTCVRDGQPPSRGYEEYPPVSVPIYVDEGY